MVILKTNNEYKQEIYRLNNIINNFDKLIDETEEELDKRKQGESYIYNYKGEMVTIDVGYAWEGIKFFIKELKHKLKEENK